MYSGTPMLRAIKALSEVAEANWEFFTLTLANWLIKFADSEAAQRLAVMYRKGTEPSDYLKLIAACEQTDVTDMLPRVQAPTLVVRDSSLQFSLFPEFSRAVTAGIPGAQLLTVDDMANATSTLLDFLRGDQRSPESPGTFERPTFRAVLFTDLVGHTEMMSRLGDEGGRAVLREHETIIRNVLKQHGGTEVKTMGDGFMASFGSVTRAVECAIALQRGVRGACGSAAVDPRRAQRGRADRGGGRSVWRDGDPRVADRGESGGWGDTRGGYGARVV
jgi:hypothetical protein